MNKIQVGELWFELDLSQPLYEQVLEQIRSFIAKGEIALGSKIPSVRELAKGLRINPNTVMRAYQELERDGLTETRRGQGTFITASGNQVRTVRSEFAARIVKDFVNRMQDLGFSVDEIIELIHQKGGDVR